MTTTSHPTEPTAPTVIPDQTAESASDLVDVGQTGIFATLAGLLPNAMIAESALADALDVTPRTIRRLVQRADLPPPVRLAGRAVWFAGRVLEFLQAKADRAAREQEKDFARFRK